MARNAIILAAGKGTRMKSKLYKVMHKVAGKPMVGHVVDQLRDAGIDNVITVVGVGAETVKDYVGDRSQYVLQEEQLGTAHAVLQAEELLKDVDGTTLVISGDSPMFRSETIESGFDYHETQDAKATVITSILEKPFGYGRIIRNEAGDVTRIVEEKDASEEERAAKEINTGTYFFDNKALFDALQEVGNNNNQGEYYLPDVVGILRQRSEVVAGYVLADQIEAIGVNDRVALSQAEALMRARINTEHMKNGVTFVDPENTYIEADVEIGSDTIIEPNVIVRSRSKIGSEVTLTSGTVIEDSIIGDGSVITSSTIEASVLKNEVTVGPDSHIRPNSTLEDGVHIGNFVEVKSSTLGKNTKAGHLTYIGNAEVGEEVNFGAGSITVNYDGKHKSTTVIGDRAFIGCNVNLVAPVEVAADSFVGAGSTITKDVPTDDLAIERGEEKLIKGYVSKMRKRFTEEDNN